MGKEPWKAAWIVLVAACLGAAPARAEPVFLDETAAGAYEMNGESVLQVEGFAGKVNFRIGQEGFLRFISSERNDRKTERPVELWKDGRTLILRPAEGYEGVPGRLEGSLPERLSLDIRLNDTELVLGNIDGDLRIEGDRLDTRLASIQGDVTVRGKDGALRAESVQGELEIDLVGEKAVVRRAFGGLTGHLENGSLAGSELAGPVELDTDGTEVSLADVSSPVRVTMSGGSLRADGLMAGGEFRMDGAGLEFLNCAGEIRVQTDASIAFEKCKAEFHFDAYGASLQGAGNEGILEVKTEDAAVSLQDLVGPTRIQGDRLTVDLRKVAGEVWVLATGSEVAIDNVNSPVSVENDFGDIHILNVSGKLEITSRDGNVQVERQIGPVAIEAEGEQVVVDWVSGRWPENSTVINHGGDILVTLPLKSPLRVDGKSEYGRIESDFPALPPAQDGKSVVGVLNRPGKPTLRLRAEGELKIRAGAGKAQ